MPSFSYTSLDRLGSCHEDLQRLFRKVVHGFDCTVLEGHRSNARQADMLAQGKSKLGPGQSKHNTLPSRAVDVAPHPVNWQDTERFYYFAGYVKATADHMGIKVRWGGDWDGDTVTTDQTFDDLPHWELHDS